MQRLLNSRQTTQSIEVICKSRVAPFFSSLQIENVVLFMKATLRQCIFFRQRALLCAFISNYCLIVK